MLTKEFFRQFLTLKFCAIIFSNENSRFVFFLSLLNRFSRLKCFMNLFHFHWCNMVINNGHNIKIFAQSYSGSNGQKSIYEKCKCFLRVFYCCKLYDNFIIKRFPKDLKNKKKVSSWSTEYLKLQAVSLAMAPLVSSVKTLLQLPS